MLCSDISIYRIDRLARLWRVLLLGCLIASFLNSLFFQRIVPTMPQGFSPCGETDLCQQGTRENRKKGWKNEQEVSIAMDRKESVQQIQELKKHAVKRKFTQMVDVVINLQDLNFKNPQHQVDFF